ncbi:hypothetical protein D0Y65_002531, partial [Glycine soja]
SEQKRGHSAEPPQHLKQTLSLIPIFFSALSARFGSSDLRCCWLGIRASSAVADLKVKVSP